jgi:hypothetical protein
MPRDVDPLKPLLSSIAMARKGHINGDDGLVETFVVYANWNSSAPIAAEALAEISARFRPDDEDLCVWIHERDATILRLCMNIDAADGAQLERLAREAITQAAETANVPGEVGELVACPVDEGS